MLIFVVEDDENIRELESYALKNSGFSVEGFDTAGAFLKRLEQCLPDLAIVDIMLPDEDGMALLARLKGSPRLGGIPVIMVTAKASEIDIVRGLDSGADDYIAKPFGVMAFVSRVKAVLRRTAGAPEHLRKVGGITLDDEKHAVWVDDTPCELTYKEFELLKLLMVYEGQVLTRERIMDRVWDTTYEGESRTVDMHIKTLRQKLGGHAAHIKTVRNLGYKLEG